MNKHPRLSKSGIEYLDYVWNFYSGCRHKEQGKCPPVPCWAEELAHRFKDHYPNGFAPTFYPEALLSPLALKKPARIGVCFMGDLFGDWVNPKIYIGNIDFHIETGEGKQVLNSNKSLRESIFDIVEVCSKHTFVFLTKNPAGMKAWSPFPDNCEVGFSAWSPDSFIDGLREISEGRGESEVVLAGAAARMVDGGRRQCLGTAGLGGHRRSDGHEKANHGTGAKLSRPDTLETLGRK